MSGHMQPYYAHDPRMRGGGGGMDVGYYSGPARPHMPAPAISAPQLPMAGMHPGLAMGPHTPHPAEPPVPPPEPKKTQSRRSSIPSIKKVTHSADLSYPYPANDEEVVILPNSTTAFITTNPTKHNEMMIMTPLLEAGPDSGWLNPYAADPKPSAELYDSPVKVPKIRLTLPFTSEEMAKQERWISFCFALSGEKGFLKLLAFDRRDDALREMMWHAMNGYSIAWSGAYLKDGKPWSGGGKLVLVDNVEGAMKVDESGEEIGVIA